MNLTQYTITVAGRPNSLYKEHKPTNLPTPGSRPIDIVVVLHGHSGDVDSLVDEWDAAPASWDNRAIMLVFVQARVWAYDNKRAWVFTGGSVETPPHTLAAEDAYLLAVKAHVAARLVSIGHTVGRFVLVGFSSGGYRAAECWIKQSNEWAAMAQVCSGFTMEQVTTLDAPPVTRPVVALLGSADPTPYPIGHEAIATQVCGNTSSSQTEVVGTTKDLVVQHYAGGTPYQLGCVMDHPWEGSSTDDPNGMGHKWPRTSQNDPINGANAIMAALGGDGSGGAGQGMIGLRFSA